MVVGLNPASLEVQLQCKFVGLEAHTKLNKVRSNVRHNGPFILQPRFLQFEI